MLEWFQIGRQKRTNRLYAHSSFSLPGSDIIAGNESLAGSVCTRNPYFSYVSNRTGMEEGLIGFALSENSARFIGFMQY